MKVVIIGGVAGGASAAARLRRLDEKAEIIMIERTGFVSYANCGLPYYVGNVIERKENLTLQTPQSFRKRFRVDARVRQEVLEIDRNEKRVTIKKLDTGEIYQETYDKLILSPGAKANRPSIEGMDRISADGKARIMTLKTVEDTLHMKTFIDEKKPKTAVVIGGGFIGVEAAENLIRAGINTSLIQVRNQILTFLDYDMACELHGYLRAKGLQLYLNTNVSGIEETDGKLKLLIKGEPSISADFVVMAAGVSPETELAEKAGLKLGIRKTIVVDEQMRTSDPDIFAVGDAVQIKNRITGEDALFSLAGPANKQGRIAADVIAGKETGYRGALGSSVIQLFDMTAASTGLNESAAKKAGISYEKAVLFSASHASYYPGAENMTIKVLFEKESGKLLGAQITGFGGVDKRIDVLATAIFAGMTGEDLTELDLAYAPPYASAKDPVNMVGYVIENIRNGIVKQFHWDEMDALVGREDITMLDVRTDAEYARGHFKGSVHIPLDELREHLNELNPSKPVYVNCFSGLRSYLACRILMQNGFSCYNLSGGYRFASYVLSDAPYHYRAMYPCGIEKDGTDMISNKKNEK
mgnify:CR=1 FL=1